jgi:hypothetical protein
MGCMNSNLRLPPSNVICGSSESRTVAGCLEADLPVAAWFVTQNPLDPSNSHC